MKSFKKRYICVDGPFRGHHLWLGMDAKTLHFRVRGVTGRYVLDGPGTVRWEAGQS